MELLVNDRLHFEYALVSTFEFKIIKKKTQKVGFLSLILFPISLVPRNADNIEKYTIQVCL